MNILVTGAKGFIGRNLIETLHNIRDGKDKSFGLDTDITVFEYDIDTDPALLDLYCKNADFVFLILKRKRMRIQKLPVR